ncbi:hypothetical protein L0666_08385 [Octadecabacter sp. CECT 8868]|uniref:hypothetical protein n=1 Tax=Octadecabacter algicola TaxID=2909342 RepID=UPI001F376DE8|nr:hypothetical protein [Octadecabacter algicola]MCF2905003.1 hypothetical protein [Octadecabacter algicola]
MKIESIPVSWSSPQVAEMSAYELLEHYDLYLGRVQDFRQLYVRKEELPDILIEAAAFRLGCNDHDTGLFGWSPWDVDDPSVFPKIGRFLERCGQHELAAELKAFVGKLSRFSHEEVLAFLTHTGGLTSAKSDAINEVVVNGFDSAKFNDEMWLQAARVGAELAESSGVFRKYPDPESRRAAERNIVEMLPDYERRQQQKTIWRTILPFHELLVSVGERYFHDHSLKITRHDGSVLFRDDAHKYDNILAFEDFSEVHLLRSTKREWLCCRVEDTAWLVDPTTGNKVASAPCSASENT